MNSNKKNVVRQMPFIVAVAIIIMSAFGKLASPKELVDHYAQLNLFPYVRMLGVIELTFIALFLYRPTFKIGFLLLSAYFGGAIATELSHGNQIFIPMVILVLIWVAAFLRKPSMFMEQQNQMVRS